MTELNERTSPVFGLIVGQEYSTVQAINICTVVTKKGGGREGSTDQEVSRRDRADRDR